MNAAGGAAGACGGLIVSEVRFDDRVAIVTGAGGGLGRTYALMLASRGAAVVVNDLGGASDGTGGSSSMADAVVKEITDAGGKAVSNYDSVATPEGGENITKTAVDNFGRVDIVVNNAGILRDKTFAKLEPQNLEAVLDVHLKGAFFVTQPAFRQMKENNYGRIVFAASGAGVFGNFGQTNYGAAKMGLVGLSNVLSIEGAKNNIKSNVITPVAKTRLTEELMAQFPIDLSPEYVTPLVAYLCSEECELTHEIFDVGAGHYARIFIGLTEGWTAPAGGPPSLEQLRDNFETVRDTASYDIPSSIAGETKSMIEAVQKRG
ncbi:MAG: SDR family oxidoreductase [Myxococcales bacterium]|nr:SDR family oxidoreductase [Myxococcales bacterium]